MSAGIVPLSRHARTMTLTSAVAAYSRMVSCHHGSLTLPARLLTRSELALTCRAARYSWNVRCAKAYRPSALDEQAVARDVLEEHLAGDRRGEAPKLRLEDLKDAAGGQRADVVGHHLVGERGEQHLLGGPGHELGHVLGLDPARQQNLADLPVQVGAAAGQRTPVPVRRGDHRQQQRIDGQLL